MKRTYIKSVALMACAAILTGCGENAWNDHLDGFKEPAIGTEAVTATYALTAQDYKNISSLLEKEAGTDAEKAEAKAIGNNGYFNKEGIYPASVALPKYFETSNFPYFLSPDGSQVDVEYTEISGEPAEIKALKSAKQYTVSVADYKAAWGSDEDYIKGFAPMTPAADFLPEILKTSISDAVEGAYAVVNYNAAPTNPVFGSVDDGPKVYIDEPFAESMGDFTLENIKLPGSSSYVWSLDSKNHYMKASAFVSKVNYESEGWLISPEVKLSAGANAVLTFEQAWNFFSSMEVAAEEASVYVREVGGKWVKLKVPETPAKNGWTWVPSGNIDLSAYNGKSIQIGFCYTSTDAAAGTWELRNVKLADGAAVAQAAGVQTSTRAISETSALETKNAVYYYDGSAWSVAKGVSVLNPADYTEMGVSNNSLENAADLIPIYLKNNLPYALNGDQRFVVYNKTQVGLFVFDGTAWTLNNNGLENVTGRFSRDSKGWSFVKYIGKSTFKLFTQEQLELDRSYLIAHQGYCAMPVNAKNYGYMYTADIEAKNGTVVLPSDVNAFRFVTSVNVDGVEYKAPDGSFLILDSKDRYNYYDGSHGSFQLGETVNIEGGQIGAGYCWTASLNNDGTWKIENRYAEGNVRMLLFTLYKGTTPEFTIFTSFGDNDAYPQLYLMD